MHEVLERLAAIRVVPVVTVEDPEHAVPVARALLDGGLACIEITLRAPAGEEALRRAATLGGDLVVGAGTVLDPGQARRAVAAGAAFLASPGLDEDVLAAAGDAAVLPGVATAGELQRARRAGLEVVKLFPARHLGGIPMLRALAAPFPGMRFVPTGGVEEGDVAAWLAEPAVAFCAGSWIAPPAAVRAGDFAGITERAARVTRALG